ncbi:Rhomboid family protein [Psychroflexus salarius]|uniref:Rhomboid family protein n=1 Tax=Psychroflexus salarius TaxID=1155689 RepID=A0A1M4SJ11_9FLAO|nr:rhomboid family intramembrane serine protease [Psychroflexus salarius]SHE32195.1 Rhomboid family protein [Psychroflexus salarius]
MLNLDISAIAIILGTVLISIKGFNDYGFFERYKFEIGSIKSGDYIRMISSAFLHIDYTHLFVNMLTLYFFADSVIYFVGRIGFILIYIVSLILGNVLSYLFHKNENYYTAVGASGAVIGVLYASILFRPDMMLGLFFFIPMPAYVFGIGYLLYSIWGMRAKRDNIGHDAHFGGAMGGFILGIILNPSVLSSNLYMVILLAVPIVFLFVLKYLNKL